MRARAANGARSMQKGTVVVNPELEFKAIIAALAGASQEEEAEIGRSDLASVLHVASPMLIDRIVTMAKRDNRMRRCLSAARYYSGLPKATCDKIDSVLQVPFPAAKRPRR